MTRKGRLLDRRSAAELVSREYFGASKRSAERWPIPGVLVNGKVHLREADVRAYAQAMVDNAPATSPLVRKDR